MNEYLCFFCSSYKYEKEGGKMEILQKTCLVLTIIGAINWGLIGILDFNLVEAIFGADTLFTNIVYILVGIAGLINIGILFEHIENKE